MDESHNHQELLKSTTLLLDVRRTDLHSRFFHVFQYEWASELLQDVERIQFDYDAFSKSIDARLFGYGGWLYWLMYLKGYNQYRADSVVTDHNVYYQYLTLRDAALDADPTLRGLSNPEAAIERIRRRYADCDQLGAAATAARFAEEELDPITVFVRVPPAEEDALTIYSFGAFEAMRARLIDGHHRLFAARLFGIQRVRFRVLAEPTSVPEVAGHIDHVSFDGHKLQIRGWATPLSVDVQGVEVRSHGRTICRAPLTLDVNENAAEEEQRFAFVIDTDVSASDLGPLDIMLLSDWLPVGRMSLGSVNEGQAI